MEEEIVVWGWVRGMRDLNKEKIDPLGLGLWPNQRGIRRGCDGEGQRCLRQEIVMR